MIVKLPQPEIETKPPLIWQHPDERQRPDVAEALQKGDSFRIFRSNNDDALESYDGLG